MTKVLNLSRLNRKLAALPRFAVTNIRLSMEQAAQQTVDTMKSLVAVDRGDLRNSIGWTWGEAPKGSLTISSVKTDTNGMTITIYAGDDKAYYARWVEFGTAPHINGGKFAGTANKGSKAQPFFFVSWRANKKSAKALMRKAVRLSAKQAAGR